MFMSRKCLWFIALDHRITEMYTIYVLLSRHLLVTYFTRIFEIFFASTYAICARFVTLWIVNVSKTYQFKCCSLVYKYLHCLVCLPIVHCCWVLWNVTTQCLAVTGGAGIGKCDRLSQTSWLLVSTVILYIVTYLLTYLLTFLYLSLVFCCVLFQGLYPYIHLDFST